MERSYYSCKLCLLNKLRDKIKKIKKNVKLLFALKLIINVSCFDKEAMGCAFQFVEIFSKSE